jgi:hypothetical protein
MNEDDLDNDEWGAKQFGRTPFGVNWPADTFAGAGLNLGIALIRMYVIVIYKPMKPLVRRLAPVGRHA